VRWTWQHIIIDYEVHCLFVGQEQHVNHAIPVNVGKVEYLTVFNRGDVVNLGKTKTM